MSSSEDLSTMSPQTPSQSAAPASSSSHGPPPDANGSGGKLCPSPFLRVPPLPPPQHSAKVVHGNTNADHIAGGVDAVKVVEEEQSNQRNSMLLEDIERSEGEVERLKEVYRGQMRFANNMELSSMELMEHIHSLNEKQASLTEKKAALTKKKAALTEINAALWEKKASLTKKKAALTENNAALNTQVAALQAALAQLNIHT